MKLSDVSVVVCAKNEESRISECIDNLNSIGVGEIIIVDGNSSDCTYDIAIAKSVSVFQDQGTGLGAARNLGVMAASRKIILNFGIDNIITKENLEKMLSDLMTNNYLGVSAQTRIKGKDYLSRCLDIYKTARMFEGERDVIGTPTLFESSILKSFLYDETCVYSDDAELCERMLNKRGGKFYISVATVEEVGENSIAAIRRRWKLYGQSDHEIYSRHNDEWTLIRKLKSLTYPFRKEFAGPILSVNLKKSIFILPFLTFITFYRYVGWVQCSWLKK